MDPKNQIDEVADLFIADKTICGIGNTPSGFTADRILDAGDKIVCPGFIEIGCDLEGLSPDTFNIKQELRAATAGGFTVVTLLPISNANFEQLGSIGPEKGRSGEAKVKHLGSLTLEQKGEVLSEMEALKAAGCIGLATNGKSVINTSVLRNALAYASSLDLLILLDSHDAWLNNGGVMRSGPSSIMAGLAGVPNSSELIGLMRNLILVEEIGVRAHMRNLSVSESAVLIARFSGAKVSSDVRQQYEFNPYPRWVQTNLNPEPVSINTVIKFLNLKLSDEAITKVNTPNILIAGCGTGEQSIGTGARYRMKRSAREASA